jgi:hypothetical protein
VCGNVGSTAALQPADRELTFFCRHKRASLPPGVTPEHFDMKSPRQLARNALCWADDNCAKAGPLMATADMIATMATVDVRMPRSSMSKVPPKQPYRAVPNCHLKRNLP